MPAREAVVLDFTNPVCADIDDSLLDINELRVGLPVVADGETRCWYARTDPKTFEERLVEHRAPTKRTIGSRIMHADMLGRLAGWLLDHSYLAAAAAYVSGALDPGKHALPDPEATKDLLATLRGAKEECAARKRRGLSKDRKQALKDESYLEAAIFCVQRWRYD